MRTILILIKKEFKQIFRNKQMLPIMFALPVIQLLVLVNAATFEIKKINLDIIDNDYSASSRTLINNFLASNYFILNNSGNNYEKAEKEIYKNNSTMILIIPNNFEKDIFRLQSPKVQFVINAEDGSAAGVTSSYAANIVLNFNQNILLDKKLNIPPMKLSSINPIERYWYNPKMNYRQYMIPGILGILVSIIALLLSAMNVVREKEIGTIEQLNVTPIKKYQFILGKLIPFWIIGLFELGFGLLVAYLAYGLLLQGSLFLIFFLGGIYLVVVLSGGLLISTVSDTQQQSLFISFFFMIVLILMSGLFTPVDSMPKWAQWVSFFDPFTHFVEILRRVMLKGANLYEVREPAITITVYAIVLLTIAIMRYKKVND
jgi:ABC-2 type transport system permease protein